MKKIILLSALILSSCGENAPDGYFCTSSYKDYTGNVKFYDTLVCDKNETPHRWICDQEKRASFIIECAEAANPKSDEEGEDLVAQCEYTSRNLFCTRENLKIK
jgi:hypothetical protein